MQLKVQARVLRWVQYLCKQCSADEEYARLGNANSVC